MEERVVKLNLDLGLRGRSLLALAEISDAQMLGLVDLAIQLKARKKAQEHLDNPLLRGKNLCLVFEKSSTRTRCAGTVAARDEGASVEYLGRGDIHLGKKESVEDTARVLGRMFDGILFRGFAHATAETLAREARVPVWNGLTDTWHPTQILADLQTMKEHFGTLEDLKVVFVGDGRNNVCNSLLVGCAKAGIDVVDCCPPALSPAPEVLAVAREAAERNGSRVEVVHDPGEAVAEANVVYTDVWVSMGEESRFDERLHLLEPYRVDMALMRRTGQLAHDGVIFLHCLPAFHNTETELTRRLGPLEVTDDVFEAPFSKVFDEAENRMHTIKAILLASLAAP
ncbi:MAG: ornithine carbamoyltransferase [Lentisphaeria bacterium]|nr:ornithine carbamoyltransferase [Lentisphaeria bacterium]